MSRWRHRRGLSVRGGREVRDPTDVRGDRSPRAKVGRARIRGLGGVGLLDELAAGSAGAMTGFSHPAVLANVLRAYRTGGFAAARDVWAPWLPLANFEGQLRVGLAIRKEVLRRRGVIASGRARHRRCRCPPRWSDCSKNTSLQCPQRLRSQ